jgi:type VI secretion system protein ImpH
MEAAGGRADHPLSDAAQRPLADAVTGRGQPAQAFDFFAALRAIEAALEREAERAAKEGRSDGRARTLDAAARFVVDPALAFPATQVVDVAPLPADAPPTDPDARPAEGPRVQMTVSFLGLIGASGALPYHYTVEAIQLLRDRERALPEFLDVFHTRLLLHFYRAWRKHDVTTLYESGRRRRAAGNLAEDDDGPSDGDLFKECLLGLMGMNSPGHRARADVSLDAHLRYAAFFAQHRRNATSLGQMLTDYFGVPFTVEQFQFQWLRLPPEDHSQLPVPGELRTFHNRLGHDVVLGQHVVDCQGRFRLLVGPLDFADYLRFIRDGVDLDRACYLTRLYVRTEFDFDVQPVLRREQIPKWQLTSTKGDQRLGRTIWLKSVDSKRDFAQMAYQARDMGSH